MELPKVKRMLNPETNDKRKLQNEKEVVGKDGKRLKGQRIEARGAVLKLSGKCSVFVVDIIKENGFVLCIARILPTIRPPSYICFIYQ